MENKMSVIELNRMYDYIRCGALFDAELKTESTSVPLIFLIRTSEYYCEMKTIDLIWFIQMELTSDSCKCQSLSATVEHSFM